MMPKYPKRKVTKCLTSADRMRTIRHVRIRTGAQLRSVRRERHLSQAKLAHLTGIAQYKISSYELSNNVLSDPDLAKISSVLATLTDDQVRRLRVKRYQKHERSQVAGSTPRRSYARTEGNDDYLADLDSLASLAHKPRQPDAPNALSLFSGCGGLSYGIKAAGFNLVAFSELNPAYRALYRDNFPEAPELVPDVQTIDPTMISSLRRTYGDIDLMIGGPPCQGFSLAGKRDPRDSRNRLLYQYVCIAEWARPKAVIMENVRLLTSMRTPDGQLVTDSIVREFRRIGYEACFFIVNAKDYGVPQHRDRVIFLAVSQGRPLGSGLPRTHSVRPNLFDNLQPFRTFGDAVSDLEYLESGERSAVDPWHAAVHHPDHVVRWLLNVPEGMSAHENSDPSLRPPSGYNTTYKRQVWDEPGATVGTTFAMISGCRNVHPIATRSLTVREAMRLQSFPDSFRLTGKIGDVRTAIGNAVPPLLARALGQHIINTYIL